MEATPFSVSSSAQLTYTEPNKVHQSLYSGLSKHRLLKIE